MSVLNSSVSTSAMRVLVERDPPPGRRVERASGNELVIPVAPREAPDCTT